MGKAFDNFIFDLLHNSNHSGSSEFTLVSDNAKSHPATPFDDDIIDDDESDYDEDDDINDGFIILGVRENAIDDFGGSPDLRWEETQTATKLQGAAKSPNSFPSPPRRRLGEDPPKRKTFHGGTIGSKKTVEMVPSIRKQVSKNDALMATTMMPQTLKSLPYQTQAPATMQRARRRRHRRTPPSCLVQEIVTEALKTTSEDASIPPPPPPPLPSSFKPRRHSSCGSTPFFPRRPLTAEFSAEYTLSSSHHSGILEENSSPTTRRRHHSYQPAAPPTASPRWRKRVVEPSTIRKQCNDKLNLVF